MDHLVDCDKQAESDYRYPDQVALLFLLRQSGSIRVELEAGAVLKARFFPVGRFEPETVFGHFWSRFRISRREASRRRAFPTEGFRTPGLGYLPS